MIQTSVKMPVKMRCPVEVSKRPPVDVHRVVEERT